jgi:hypothetical protein
MHACCLSTKRGVIRRRGPRRTFYTYIDSTRLDCESNKSANTSVTRVTFGFGRGRVTVSGRCELCRWAPRRLDGMHRDLRDDSGRGRAEGRRCRRSDRQPEGVDSPEFKLRQLWGR